MKTMSKKARLTVVWLRKCKYGLWFEAYLFRLLLLMYQFQLFITISLVLFLSYLEREKHPESV